MGNLIVVTGSPGSGKTCVAVKLAKELYQKEKKPVILLSPDLYVPIMPFLFPRKNQQVYSLGGVLEHTEITPNDILKALVTTKNQKNFGVLGYTRGEHVYSYAQPTPDKVQQLLTGVQQLGHHVVVDATGRTEDLISQCSLLQASRLVQLIVPDVKSLAYYLSLGRELYPDAGGIQVLNRVQGEIPSAEPEVLEFFKHIQVTLPHSKELGYQAMSGLLLDSMGDGKYRAAMAALAKAVTT